MANGTCSFDSISKLEVQIYMREDQLVLRGRPVAKIYVRDDGVLEFRTAGPADYSRAMKVRNIRKMKTMPEVAVNHVNKLQLDVAIEFGVRHAELVMIAHSHDRALQLLQIRDAILFQKQRYPGGPFRQKMLDLKSVAPQAVACHCSLFTNVMSAEANSQDNPDVIVVCEDKTFHCHRAILAQHSTTFERMFNDDKFDQAKEGLILVADFTSETMQEILRFIYCGYIDVDISASNISPKAQHELIYAATKYALEMLIRYLQAGFEENLDAQTACRYLDWADRFGLEYLKRACFGLMTKLESRDAVLTSPEWQKIVGNKCLMTEFYRFVTRD